MIMFLPKSFQVCRSRKHDSILTRTVFPRLARIFHDVITVQGSKRSTVGIVNRSATAMLGATKVEGN